MGFHLFVFVHGFQASSLDLRTFKNIASAYMPNALFLCSKTNEDNTEGSIEQMGLNLANEVSKYINEQCKLKSK